MITTVFIAIGAATVAISGQRPDVSGSRLVMLAVTVWAFLFLAFVILGGLRQRLYQRDEQRPADQRRRAAIGRRFIIAFAALALIVGRIITMYLAGELTVNSTVFTVIFTATFALIFSTVIDAVLRRRQSRHTSTHI